MIGLLSESEREQIQILLGRAPHGTYQIEKRDLKGSPQVISVFPLVKGAPFPTLYWLVCPILKKSISHLEREGLIGEIEKKLSEEPRLKKQLYNDHRCYQEKRAELAKILPPDQYQQFKEFSWDKLGIGGIRDWDHIKCLHLHYAHYLAHTNCIGEIVHQHLSQASSRAK